VQTRVERVVYRRDDEPQSGPWVFYASELPAFVAAWFPAVSGFAGSYRAEERKRLDVRRLDVPQHAWLSYIPELVTRHVHPAAHLAAGFRVPARGQRDSLYYHGRWEDDGAWQALASAIPDAYVPSFWPALDLLLQSYRSRRFPHIRPYRHGHLPRRFDATQTHASLAQLLGGYRPPARSRFNPAYHSWLDDAAGIFATVPEVAFEAAFEQLHASYITPRRKARPHDLLLWDVNRRFAGAFTEDVTLSVSAADQLLKSYRSITHRRLDVRAFEWLQDGWTGFVERDIDASARRPALDQLLAGFRVAGRARLSPSHHDWLDVGSWIAGSAFDPAFWPAIGDLLGVFRSDPGRRLDVRRLDTLFDAWLATAPTIVVPLFAPALAGLADVYRAADRRVTLDVLRNEWGGQDLSWLHDVLGLVDAEPITANDIAERWAGSVRRRERSRRR